MNALYDWAARWGLPPQAVPDLLQRLGAWEVPASAAKGSEARVQSEVRLRAREHGELLWRNNKGVLPDARGVPVRFGLANDSPEIGSRIRSADLVGLRRLVVSPAMVGMALGQFASRECKPPGWQYRGTEHEEAQLRFALIVQAQGGDARFITDAGQL